MVSLTPAAFEDKSVHDIKFPSYDISDIKTGILHFGLGNFARAHQAMYIDRLMSDGDALDWGICGVGLTPGGIRMRDTMRKQGNLFSLVVKNADKTLDARIVGCIHEYLFGPDGTEKIVQKLSTPELRVVSLTITEGGYNFKETTGEFDFSHPGVVHDLTVNEQPKTVFGIVTEALRRRRDAGLPAFTVMSCDNIPDNGHLARNCFLSFAKAKDPELAEWMSDKVSFPSSMVDRITPGTTDDDRKLMVEKFGLADTWPVMCESFTQWVLEDDFSNGRPPYELAGVQMVKDVVPYELMKLRLLNASHQAMAYFGYLSGHQYSFQAAEDPLIRELLRKYMNTEAIPTLRPVPGIDLDEYVTTLLERFSNPEVRDTLARLCQQSSDLIPKFLLPVVKDNLAKGGNVALSAAVVASWARYAEGTDEKGQPINVVDKLAGQLTPIAKTQGEHPLAFIENKDLFGDLASHKEFVEPYRDALAKLKKDGAQATLKAILASPPN